MHNWIIGSGAATYGIIAVVVHEWYKKVVHEEIFGNLKWM